MEKERLIFKKINLAMRVYFLYNLKEFNFIIK